MLEGLLGLVLLGGCIIGKLAENDFDLGKVVDEEVKRLEKENERLDKEIDRKFKEAERKFRDLDNK